MTPTHVYVFGPLGGPYKIGYTNNLKTRIYDLLNTGASRHAISRSARRHSTFWHHETVPNRDMAKKVERKAHALLENKRVVHPMFLFARTHCNQEWFAVDLVTAVRAVRRAAKQVMK